MEQIATGCRYVVCGGVESEAWEDAADDAYLAEDSPEPVSDELFVMTTSHPGEPADEAAFFFVHNTRFGDHDFAHHPVLMVGEDAAMRGRLVAAIRGEI